MTMIKNVTAGAAGRYSDLEAGSAHEGILALQTISCLIKETTPVIH